MVKSIWTTLKVPALIGFGLTLPLMLLEVVNRWNFHEGFPWSLFGVLWLSAAIFCAVLLSLIQKARLGHNLLAQLPSLVFKIALLLVIAALWMGILRDQWPCFMGVPNCD